MSPAEKQLWVQTPCPSSSTGLPSVTKKHSQLSVPATTFGFHTALPYHLARIVADAEAAEAHGVVVLALGILGDFALIVTVLREELVQLCQESGVTDHPRPQTLLIQHGQDPSLTLGQGNKINITLIWSFKMSKSSLLSPQPSHILFPLARGERESGRQRREMFRQSRKGSP